MSNLDSQIDGALHRSEGHPNTTAAVAPGTDASAVYQRYDPTLPPLCEERTLRLDWDSQETLVRDVPGEFPIVNHAFGHGLKSAIGYLMVEP